ncbi:hypothetical protein B0G77_4559 [Paraburkholderia sp. BL10I2N1]|nr:hypothetical protein B0G77_4559 [Paraburkholderia sp. BL10I2N1]
MDEGLSDSESLSVVLESLLWLKDIFLAIKFISLYMKGNSQISPQAERAQEYFANEIGRNIFIYAQARPWLVFMYANY